MIYEPVNQDEPIRQGDLFRNLPRVDISLTDITVLARDQDTDSIEHRSMSWPEALDSEEASEVTTVDGDQVSLLRAVLPVSPVSGIVVTQDCDAMRAEELSLCEISPLVTLYKGATYKKAKDWAGFLTKQGGDHVRWFYLPQDESIGFENRMAVDFRSIFRLPRQDLKSLISLRIGRLNQIAYEHFREKMAHFFRRYPYDPWYPLSKEEFEAYSKDCPEPVSPFPWQK